MCHCGSRLFPCGQFLGGQLLLMLLYGALLGVGAKLISDGSEILLDLFPSWGTVIGAGACGVTPPPPHGTALSPRTLRHCFVIALMCVCVCVCAFVYT